jgi:sporulation protein YtfJ
MEQKNPINEILNTTLQNLRGLADVNMVTGNPIAAGDGIVIIPVSKVSFGYGLGGTDIPTDKQNSPFGGGSGGGVSIEPLGFIVVNKDKVELLQLYTVDNTTADRVVGMVPEMVDKISALFKKSPADSAKSKEETGKA